MVTNLAHLAPTNRHRYSQSNGMDGHHKSSQIIKNYQKIQIINHYKWSQISPTWHPPTDTDTARAMAWMVITNHHKSSKIIKKFKS